ncbi:MAG: stage V sporulation protein AC [Faecousia sp.]
MTNEEYGRLADSLAPKSKCWRNCFNAFWTGGLICLIGQLLMNGFQALHLSKDLSGTATSVCLVFLSALLTGLAVYDDIAKLAGAGTLVPITGFANSIAAPAVEFQTEGLILGTCAKMFTIAGPVLVFGTAASAIYGLIYWIWTLF